MLPRVPLSFQSKTYNLSTLHFKKAPENNLEVSKVLENNLESLNLQENRIKLIAMQKQVADRVIPPLTSYEIMDKVLGSNDRGHIPGRGKIVTGLESSPTSGAHFNQQAGSSSNFTPFIFRPSSSTHPHNALAEFNSDPDLYQDIMNLDGCYKPVRDDVDEDEDDNGDE
nr:hypothetical protein [Tanacetum cinerariifolium]